MSVIFAEIIKEITEFLMISAKIIKKISAVSVFSHATTYNPFSFCKFLYGIGKKKYIFFRNVKKNMAISKKFHIFAI